MAEATAKDGSYQRSAMVNCRMLCPRVPRLHAGSLAGSMRGQRPPEGQANGFCSLTVVNRGFRVRLTTGFQPSRRKTRPRCRACGGRLAARRAPPPPRSATNFSLTPYAGIG